MDAQTLVDAAALLGRQREAAARAAPPSAPARQAALTRLERALLRHRPAIARAVSDDFRSRSPVETDLLELLPCLGAIRHARRNLPRWMRPERRHVPLTVGTGRATVRHQPLGVVGIVAPWNYPLLLCIAPLVDALAAGNRVMIKPSEYVPAFTAVLDRVLAEAFDRSEVALVTGGPEQAAAFCALPFDHLLFTGSTAVGRKVAQAAAANLTPVTLELGGKSPALVCPDADLERAARSIAHGKFVNAGQTCIAPDYVLVDAPRLDALHDAIARHVRRAWRRGDSDATAIITDRHAARLHAALSEAQGAGAAITRLFEDTPARLAPTLARHVPADAALMREEIFGPILPLVPYRTRAEAIALINARPRPLALYCFTRDRAALADILSRTRSGGVTVNGTLLHAASNELPFGGIGPSGTGAYHGRDGFRRFSHARAVYEVGALNPFDQFLMPPYRAPTRRFIDLLIRGRPGRSQAGTTDPR